MEGLGAMRDALAERLLANVMAWTPEDVARERPVLQALAALKYDEYQQFSPGMRFVESRTANPSRSSNTFGTASLDSKIDGPNDLARLYRR
jgi:hypothetical protein